MDEHFHDTYFKSTDSAVQLEIGRAAVSNLLAWLGWLQAVETFSVKWEDIITTRPEEGPSIGLLLGMGAIQIFLQKQTKSSQATTADVVVAWTTTSGKSLGSWLDRL